MISPCIGTIIIYFFLAPHRLFSIALRIKLSITYDTLPQSINPYLLCTTAIRLLFLFHFLRFSIFHLLWGCSMQAEDSCTISASKISPHFQSRSCGLQVWPLVPQLRLPKFVRNYGLSRHGIIVENSNLAVGDNLGSGESHVTS